MATAKPTKLIVDCSTGERTVVELTAAEIAERAVKLAVHSGRVTVKASDIKLAAKY